MDTKLHKLFDKSRHEVKNEMDFVRPHGELGFGTVPSSAADSHHLDVDASSDMSMSSDNNGSSLCEYDLDAKLEGERERSAGYDHLVVEDGSPDWEDETMSDGDDDYIEEDEDDEINMEAYDAANVEENGLHQTEQAGVIHLVHGWTARGHPDEVGWPSMFRLRF